MREPPGWRLADEGNSDRVPSSNMKFGAPADRSGDGAFGLEFRLQAVQWFRERRRLKAELRTIRSGISRCIGIATAVQRYVTRENASHTQAGRIRSAAHVARS